MRVHRFRIDGFEPLFGSFLCVLSRVSVPLLQLPDQHIAVAVDDIQIVIGQLSPLLFGFSLDLLPLACNLVRVQI